MKTPTITTRIAKDVAAAATEVSGNENRSIADQLSHWARIGMQLERAATRDHRRVLAVVQGRAEFNELAVDERNLAHALIDADIAGQAAITEFGSTIRRSTGAATVAMDDDGNVVRTLPDGTTVVLVASGDA